MDCCCKMLKYIVFLVNFFVTLAGLALLILASIILVNIKKGVFDAAEGDTKIFYWASLIMIAFGIILTVVGFLGCCGASRESQCLLGSYAVVMLIGIGLAIAGTVVLHKEKENVVDKARQSVKKLFDNVANKVKSAIALQETLECCGATSFKDWNQPSLIDQFPPSCCKQRDSKSCRNPWSGDSSLSTSASKELYNKGCIEVVEKVTKDLVYSSPVVLGIVVLIQIIAFVFSLALCCAVRSNSYKAAVYH